LMDFTLSLYQVGFQLRGMASTGAWSFSSNLASWSWI